MKVMSARLDGSDRRVLLKRSRGWVVELQLDREGRRVAFAPFRTKRRAGLLVVGVRGGTPRDVLADVRRFEVVSGLGWSPNGRRLAFEGTIERGGGNQTYLWTIHRDGSHLKRRIPLQPRSTSPSLPWTSKGIIYPHGQSIRLLRPGGDSELLLRNASDPRTSGDGRWMVVYRITDRDRTSVWRCRPNGSNLQRLSAYPDPEVGYLPTVTPSFDGRSLLSPADLPSNGGSDFRTIIWDAGKPPSDYDRVLRFTRGSFVVTWN